MVGILSQRPPSSSTSSVRISNKRLPCEPMERSCRVNGDWGYEMVLKMVFHLTKQHVLKMRRLAGYDAQQEGGKGDTEATLNQLIDDAHSLVDDEKRAKMRRGDSRCNRYRVNLSNSC